MEGRRRAIQAVVLLMSLNYYECYGFTRSLTIPRDDHHAVHDAVVGSRRSISTFRPQYFNAPFVRETRALKSQGDSCSETSRGDFVRGVAAALALSMGAWSAIFDASSSAWGVGLQPGERTTEPPPALLLFPALRAKLATKRLCELLEDPTKWDEAREALRNPPLAPGDFMRAFRTYSDADPEQHLALDLYRIQSQEALKAVTELLAYLASEKSKGAEILPEDVTDLRNAGKSVVQGIDDFLKLAPHEDVALVERSAIETARAATTLSTIPFEARNSATGTRGLRGVVAGDEAFAGGLWLNER